MRREWELRTRMGWTYGDTHFSVWELVHIDVKKHVG